MAPEADELSRPFWAGCNDGRLVLQRCGRCALFIHHPERRCPYCGSDELTSGEVSGRGVIETFTVVHRSFVPAYREAAPYGVGWVSLDDQPGLRLFGKIDGAIPDVGPGSGAAGAEDRAAEAEMLDTREMGVIEIGARVQVAFADVLEFGKVPYFVCE